jgi:predicted adenylyl cyclase CyaB
MQEIEVKILNIDKQKVIAQLESLGAKKVLDCEMCSSTFDFADKRLAKEGKFLRLRTKGGITELTLKEKVSTEQAKINEEHEVIVSDKNCLRGILHGLGLKEVKTDAKKHRVEYVLGNVHFEIDTLAENIPPLLEVEAPTLEEVQKAVEMLGFSMKDDAKPWSGKDVREHYGK